MENINEKSNDYNSAVLKEPIKRIATELHTETMSINMTTKKDASINERISSLIGTQLSSLDYYTTLQNMVMSGIISILASKEKTSKDETTLTDLKAILNVLKTGTSLLNTNQDTISKIKSQFGTSNSTLETMREVLTNLGLDESLPYEARLRIQSALINSGNTFS